MVILNNSNPKRSTMGRLLGKASMVRYLHSRAMASCALAHTKANNQDCEIKANNCRPTTPQSHFLGCNSPSHYTHLCRRFQPTNNSCDWRGYERFLTRPLGVSPLRFARLLVGWKKPLLSHFHGYSVSLLSQAQTNL